jgi:hypothetical protein
MGGAPAHTIVAQCEDIISGARLGLASSWNLGDGEVCSAEWAPDTSEQQDDLAAHCENRSGARYLKFQRNESTGTVLCLFKVSSEVGASNNSAPAQSSGKSDSLISAELPELVREWTDLCLKKEQNRDKETTDCWLDAAKAIDSHAADADAPLAKEINELQAAWLHRARDLLTVQAKEKTAIQSVSLVSEEPLQPDSLTVENVPQSPPIAPPVVEQPAGMELEEPVLQESPAELEDATRSPQRKPPHEPLHKSEQRQAASKETAAGKTTLRADNPKKLTQAKPRRTKTAQKPLARKQVALAVTNHKVVKAKPAVRRKQVVTLPFLSKTATSSKCFVAIEWC